MTIRMYSHDVESHKCCGICAFWEGKRKLDRSWNCFEFDETRSYPCGENPIGKHNISGLSSCHKWELASGLKLPTPPKQDPFKQESTRKQESNPVSRNTRNSHTSSSGSKHFKTDEEPERLFKGEGFAAIYDAGNIIERVWVIGIKLLSYLVHFVCYLGKIKVPETVGSLMAKINKGLEEIKDYEKRGVVLSDEEYEARIKEIEDNMAAVENISIDYDPYYEIARKIVVGIILLTCSVYGAIWYFSL